jgi:hypothetical protein
MPDDALSAVLVKLFIDRQLVVDTSVVDSSRPHRALAGRRSASSPTSTARAAPGRRIRGPWRPKSCPVDLVP